jgi:hypothetical protein
MRGAAEMGKQRRAEQQQGRSLIVWTPMAGAGVNGNTPARNSPVTSSTLMSLGRAN